MKQKEYDRLKALADEYDLEYEMTGKWYNRMQVRPESAVCPDGLGEPLTEFEAKRIIEKLPVDKLTQLVSAINMVEENENHTRYFYIARYAQRFANDMTRSEQTNQSNEAEICTDDRHELCDCVAW